MIDNTYTTSDEGENVILVQETGRQWYCGDIFCGGDAEVNPPSCVVSVSNRNVKFLADSGSPFTLISMADFKNIDDMVVQDSQIKMFAYEGKHIEVVGKFEATLKFEGKCAVGMVYVVKKGANLFVWEE
ncbi:hypothetical protein NDU88_006807 [Pleurodeles waltl]|uniref:Uncharacterized protein n=1 Tax=Pleurodeles waltl TaxID=8319 RepID=A0AAV7VS21_PLEWA|nr:hypothetical protein NDU88_006807 [Pleurodeles waltl]